MAALVGIDLGTTNTVVARATVAGNVQPEIVQIPQLVASGEVERRALYPSCLYAPLPGEATNDPWGDAPWITGELARRRGGEVPGRAVFSSKSWLCHAGVDRTAPILPWGAEDEALPRLSPVEAATRLLAHVKVEIGQADEIVLTVPASFDEVARELTVLAAQRAGLSVRLLEEPQAAFYDWMHRQGASALEALLAERSRARVLVCDVGGGTTDLSLLEVTRDAAGAPAVERVAVGRHLLLGGDNMDLTLAAIAEQRFGQRLDPGRFGQLVAACRAAKEALLSNGAPEEAPVTVLAAGARLVGGTLTTRLSREEVERVVLDGFFPRVAADAPPERARGALVAFGLPYERDVAVTRHVATFLRRHGGAAPDAVLLNGGVFRAERLRARLLEVIGSWRGSPIEELADADPDLAVARGAVAYALALRGTGPRIESGAARGYYVGLAADGGAQKAMCVVPRGAKEGSVHAATSRPVALVVGRPVRFDLFASDDDRVDAPGDVVAIDQESFVALPPVATAFGERPGSRRPPSDETLPVVVEGELTPIGTLDLACVEAEPEAGQAPRRFRLAFQLREGAPAPASTTAPPPSVAPAAKKVDDARALIERAFGKAGGEREAKDLLRDLEKTLGDRFEWPLSTSRALYDALAPLRAARRKSEGHERVYWLLAGFCLRPGFGDPLDPDRVARLAPLFGERVAFADQARGWQQFWIAWRRVAAGLDEAAQVAMRDAIDPFLAPPEKGLKRPKKWKPEAQDDMLEAAASLERVPAARRAELGAWVLERTWTDRDPRLWGAIGRLGARVPAYASAHHVVPALTAERWIDHLLREKWDQVPTATHAAVRLARRTGDRARDVSEAVRREVEKRLVAVGAADEWVRAVREVVVVEEAERATFWGESLPAGLRLL